MADTPHPDTPHAHVKGIKGFFSNDTAGLPNWAWLLVIGAGLAAAYIVPKFLNGGSNSSQGGQTSTGTGTGSGSNNTSGLGLAIDPTTGLPYAVEGLVPSGANANGGGPSNITPPVTTPTPPIPPVHKPPKTKPPKLPPPPDTGTGDPDPFWHHRHPSSSGSAHNPQTGHNQTGTIHSGGGSRIVPRGVKPRGLPVHNLATNNSTYASVAQWPTPRSTLSDMARKHGISEERIMQLNPGLVGKPLRSGENVRIA